MSLRFDDSPAADCPFGGAIMGPVSLRVGFDIASDELVDASFEDDVERWCAMEVAGRGGGSSRFGGPGAREDVGRVAGSV